MRGSLGRWFQLDEWEVPAPRQVAHVQFESLAAAASDLRLLPRTRRARRPSSSRLKSWLATSRPSSEVDLVRRRAIESVVRSVLVVPVGEEHQLPAKSVTLVGDQQSPRTLALQRTNETFDHGDAAILADGSEALPDAPAGAPPPEALVGELPPVIADEVLRRGPCSPGRTTEKAPDVPR